MELPTVETIRRDVFEAAKRGDMTAEESRGWLDELNGIENDPPPTNPVGRKDGRLRRMTLHWLVRMRGVPSEEARARLLRA